MIIRQARSSDFKKILDFMGGRQVKRKDWHVSSKNFVLSYITNKHNFFLIALDNDVVVGTINGELWNDKGFAYVGEISAKGRNKKEIVDQMFIYFVNFCKKKKVTLINTYVRKNKKKSIDLYKSLGMKKKGEHLYLERRI